MRTIRCFTTPAITLPILAVLVTTIGCNRSPEVKEEHRTPSGPVQAGPNASQTVATGAEGRPNPITGPPPGAKTLPRPVVDLDRELRKPDLRSKDVGRLMLELATHRTAESFRVMADVVKDAVNKLQNPLPSPAEMATLEAALQNDPAFESDLALRARTIGCGLVSLSLLNLPEADNVVEETLRRLESLHGKSETGRIMLDSFALQIRQAKGGRDAGLTPWQTDMLTREE